MIEATKFIDLFKNIKLFDDVYDVTHNFNNKEKKRFSVHETHNWTEKRVRWCFKMAK